MRPVTKTSDFEPADTTQVGNTSVRATLLAATPTIKPSSAKTIYKTTDLLNFLKNMAAKNLGSPDWGKLTASEKEAVKYFYQTVFTDNANNYGLAKKPLINDLGQFCSYCGIRVTDTSLAVEHCLPKSEFPSEMLSYANFLLACFACNSSNKGAKPTYAQGVKWTGKPKPGFDEVKAEAIDHFWWAFDNDPKVYTSFTPTLYNSAGDSFTMDQATDLTNKIDTIKDGLVDATVESTDEENVTSKEIGSDSRANAIIDLVGMNKPVDAELGDRRMLNRTIAWFRAVQAYALIDALENLPPDTPKKDELIEAAFNQLLSESSDSGFYTIWAATIQYMAPVSDDSIYEQFKTATDGDNIYFPGTHTHLLP